MKPNVRTLTSEFLLCVHPKDLSIFLQDRVHARVHHVVSAFLRLKFLRLKFDGLKTTVPSSPFFSYSTQCSTEYITTSEEQCSDVIKWASLLHKLNRCLAGYSPRATTNNRPTNRAPYKRAWPGPNWPKMPVLGQIWSFLGKKSLFLLEKSKVLLPT